jgi:hypothetical protein
LASRLVAGGQLGELLQEDGFAVAHDLPGFLGREGQEGRHPAQQRLGDLVERGLGRAACQALGGAGVEAVLEHVQVEAAQVFGAEQLQLGDHGVELVDLVVGQDLCCSWAARARANWSISSISP